MPAVHPSRIQLVPGAFTPRATPPPSTVPASTSSAQNIEAAPAGSSLATNPSTVASREEELRQKLLERKSKVYKTNGNDGSTREASLEKDTPQPRELRILNASRPDSGSASSASPLPRRSSRSRSRSPARMAGRELLGSRSPSPGPTSRRERRSDGGGDRSRSRSREKNHMEETRNKSGRSSGNVSRHRSTERFSRPRSRSRDVDRGAKRVYDSEDRESRHRRDDGRYGESGYNSPRGRSAEIRPEPMASRSTHMDRPPHMDSDRTRVDERYGYGPRRDLPSRHDNGYPQRGANGRAPDPRHMGYGDYRGPAHFEQRKLEREANTLSIWPPSPKAPYRESDDELDDRDRRDRKSKSRSKRKHRSRYSSESDASEDEDERRRRRRKEKERERVREKERKKEKRREREKERERRYSSSASDFDDKDDKDKGKDRRSDRKHRRKSKERERRKSESREEDRPLTLEEMAEEQRAKAEEEAEVGPVLPSEQAQVKGRTHYKDMLKGEAEAMALFAASGQRIPRRGEIGYDQEAIKQLEESGYVMSGSRNKRMNAVRLRKENEVITAEEKRAILNLQREERGRREGMIVSQFKELMDTAIKRSGAG